VGFLIDTCAWIDVEQGALAPADVATLTRDEPVFLSPVTIAELRFGAEVAKDPGMRQKRLAALRRLQRKPLLPLDGATGDIFGSLATVRPCACIALVTAGSFPRCPTDQFPSRQRIDLTLYVLAEQKRG
jgi:hypothetical protein